MVKSAPASPTSPSTNLHEGSGGDGDDDLGNGFDYNKGGSDGGRGNGFDMAKMSLTA